MSYTTSTFPAFLESKKNTNKIFAFVANPHCYKPDEAFFFST